MFKINRKSKMVTSVEFFKLGKENHGFGLGGSFNATVALKESKFVLCLMGENKPYMPIGGKQALKSILHTCKEGETYYWKAL